MEPNGRAGLDRRFAALLRSLAAVPRLDQYPGSEWSIALAADRLLTVRGNVFADRWLKSMALDPTVCARARLDAASARLFRLVDGGTRARRTLATAQKLQRSSCHLVSRWGGVLADAMAHEPRTDHLRQAMADRAEAEFASEIEIIVTRSINEVVSMGLGHELAERMAGLLATAVLTLDGRVRRSAIETLIAAGMVSPAVGALAGAIGEITDPDIREAAIFVIGRFRESNQEILGHLHSELRSAHQANRRTAAWTFGDVFRRNGFAREDTERARQGLVALASSVAEVDDVREAAVHALSVISAALDDKSCLYTVEQALTPESRLADMCAWGLSLS